MCSITTQRLSSPPAYSKQLFSAWNNKDYHHGNPLHPGSAEWPFQTSEGNNYLMTSKTGDGVKKKKKKSKGGKRPRGGVTEVETHTSQHTLQDQVQNEE